MINACFSPLLYTNKRGIAFKGGATAQKQSVAVNDTGSVITLPFKEVTFPDKIKPVVDKADRYVAGLGGKIEGRTYVERLNSGLEFLYNAASTNGLTGIANRRKFDHDFKTCFRRAQKNGTPLSLAITDMDNLKGQVDLLGHFHGSKLIARMGQILKEEFNDKEGITPYLFGGDEFCVIFEGIGAQAAQKEMQNVFSRIKKDKKYQGSNDKYVEKLDNKIQDLEKITTKNSLQDLLLKRYRHWKDHFEKNKCLTVTAAVGDLSFCGPEDTEENFFAKVDVALDKAKTRKNCIAFYQEKGTGEVKIKVIED